MRKLICILGCLLAYHSAPVLADQSDKRLDTLFEELNSTDTRPEAAEIASEIWSIWHESDDGISNELIRRGVLAMHKRRYDIALNHFDQLIKHEPGFAEGWNKRATIYYLVGQYRNSIDDIRNVLALEPRHFGALSGLGMCYEMLGDGQAAAKAYQLALKVNPHLHRIQERLKNLQDQIRRKNI